MIAFVLNLGHRGLSVLAGGPEDWVAVTGRQRQDGQ
jgi:hypothetical protein